MSQDPLSLQQNSNPVSSSLDANQLVLLQQVTSGYSPLQLAWASGYLAAKSESAQGVALPSTSATAVAKTLTILYASQTGNAKGVASKLAENAKTAGISVVLKNTADYKAKSLKNETHLLMLPVLTVKVKRQMMRLNFMSFY